MDGKPIRISSIYIDLDEAIAMAARTEQSDQSRSDETRSSTGSSSTVTSEVPKNKRAAEEQQHYESKDQFIYIRPRKERRRHNPENVVLKGDRLGLRSIYVTKENPESTTDAKKNC